MHGLAKPALHPALLKNSARKDGARIAGEKKKMRLKSKINKLTTYDPDIEEHILKIAGTNGLLMAEFLAHGPIKETDIVERFSPLMDRKEVHQALYALRDGKVANSTQETVRLPDKKNPWVQYSWYLTLDEALFHLFGKEQRVLRDLKLTVEYEKTNNFYACPSRCMKMTFDKAYSVGFRCPNCGAEMSYLDNNPAIDNLKKAACMQEMLCGEIESRCEICRARQSLQKKRLR